MTCPCYKCEERQVNCHATCERYKRYRAELDNRKTTVGDAVTSEFIVDSIRRRKRAKNNER